MRVNIGNKSIQLPDFLLAGAAKSGTTSLYSALDRHPEIYFPDNKKEPHYFSFGGKFPAYSDPRFADKMVWRTIDYLEMYENMHEGQIGGDASTSYLYKANECIINLNRLYGEEAAKKLKILLILRNPVDRAYSHYNYLLRNGFEDLEFEEAIKPETINSRKAKRWGFDYLEYGFYEKNLKLFQSHFDEVKVLLFEDLKEVNLMNEKVYPFLNLSPLDDSKIVLNSNPSGKPKSKVLNQLLIQNKTLKTAVNVLPKGIKRSVLIQRDRLLKKNLSKEALNHNTREFLQQYYRESICKLQENINQDLTSWLT